MSLCVCVRGGGGWGVGWGVYRGGGVVWRRELLTQ